MSSRTQNASWTEGAFTARSGYSLTPEVIRTVAERTTNVAGLKVSESPYDKVAPYLTLGLRTYIGSEPLLPQALADTHRYVRNAALWLAGRGG